MLKIGYARVSSNGQNLDRQLRILKDAGVDKVFMEKVSGKNLDRKKLMLMLNSIERNDEIYVSSLDRLGRSSQDLTNIIETIRKKGGILRIQNLPSFSGINDHNLELLLTNIVLEVQKYIAENERKMIRERQREGIKIAKLRGSYKGRRPEYSENSKNPQKKLIYKKIVNLLKRKENGEKISISYISRNTGVSRNTIYHIKRSIYK